MKSAHGKALVKLIEQLRYKHSTWQVFSDFVEMAALSVSNSVDLAQHAAREERYLAIVKRYDAEEVALFPQMFAELVNALEDGFDDVLGRVFHDLELHSKWHGQFFTPYELSRALAEVTLGDREEVDRKIAERGYITALEPACGAGAMIIALAETLKERGVNYQHALHVTAVDIDPKCVHMAYLQFALLGIPAVVVHGNSLSLEEKAHWYTPAHILGGWSMRLRGKRLLATTGEPSEVAATEEVAPEPADIQVQGDLFGAAA